jgi:hypothetical protein
MDHREMKRESVELTELFRTGTINGFLKTTKLNFGCIKGGTLLTE